MMKNKPKALVLLSGGLDSVVSLAAIRQNSDIEIALTFNYGQKAFRSELSASKNICRHYNIEHKVIELDWLKEISKTKVPKLNESDLENKTLMQKTAKSAWVPNRNGLFINIAASFCDAMELDEIIIGANKEEAATFKDNSKAFIDAINCSLKNSARTAPKVIAPLIEMDKKEIIEKAVELNVPFELIRSCYNDTEKNCGTCESCLRLKRAVKLSKNEHLLKILF